MSKNLLIKKVKHKDEETDVLIESGKITRLGKNLKARASKTIDGRGKAILPGFYNLHTHAAMTLLRGYAEDVELEEWLTKKIWPAEAKFSEEDIYWGTKLACLEMIKSGTVCFNDMYWHQEAALQAVAETRLRAFIGLTMIDGHSLGFHKDKNEAWEKIKKKQTAKIKFALAPHALYTVARENLEWAARFAKDNKLLIHFHVSETEKEVADCREKYDCRPIEFLDKIGFLDSNVILAHSIWLSEKEIKILAQRKCHLVYNPTSNMKLSSGVMSFSKLKREGINICLGTDSASSNNNLDMMEEVKLAAVLQKLTNGQEIKVKDVFAAATRNGARALGIKSGIVKEGQEADFILVDTERLDFLPGFNLLNDLVFSASSECVDTVVCGGDILMENREIQGEKEFIKEIKKRYGACQGRA